jgi:molecular chaperone GrpE
MSSKHRDPRAEGEAKPGQDGGKDTAPLPSDLPSGAGMDTVAEAAPREAYEAAPAAEPDAPAGEAAKLASLEAELALLREELSAVNDKYLRKLADDVNFRKRMAREKEDGQRYALASLLSDLVPVLDDFDRAVASAESSKEYAVLHDGILLIRRQMGQMLDNKYGLKPFVPLDLPFDPNRHEAVAMDQGKQGECGDEARVSEVFLPGYGLHDRILRTAKVRVRMPAAATAAGDAAAPVGGDQGEPGTGAGA